VVEDEADGAVPGEVDRGAAEGVGEGGGQVGGGVAGLGHDAQEAGDLALGQQAEQLVLAAREGAVERGPAHPRGPGHVPEGGLGHAPAGDQRHGGVEGPLLGGRRHHGDVGHERDTTTILVSLQRLVPPSGPNVGRHPAA
jgi:hypothetical protein